MGLVSNAILRTTAGAFILNSGLGKAKMDEGTYGYLKGMASTGVPQVNKLSDKQFGQALTAAEIALGAALLCPIVPAKVAGLGLAGFGAGMLTMYFKNDDMTLEDGIRPSQEGTALAKDIFLVSSGLALITSRKGLL